MIELRRGARWYLRIGLSLVLLADLVMLGGMLSLEGPGPRALEGAPALLRALAGHPELTLPWVALGLALLARFVLAPGRIGSGLGALAVLFVLCEARAASVGGPERFLFAGGTVLVGWVAGLVFVRASGGDRESEERGAELGAVAALAAIYVNAGLQKLALSGLGWADGDNLRMLVLVQRELGSASTDPLAELLVRSRPVAFALAAFVELAQLAAIAYPFHRRARAVVGTMLIAFHVGVRLLTPISFPQSIALLVLFSYPWERVVDRLAPSPPGVLPAGAGTLAGRPVRGALALAAIFGGLVLLAALPPVRAMITSLSHVEDVRPGAEPATPPEPPPPFDAGSARAIGISRIGEAVGPCTVVGVAGLGTEVQATFDCAGTPLVVEIVPHGERPYTPPQQSNEYDLFYVGGPGGAMADPVARDAVLVEIARRIDAH